MGSLSPAAYYHPEQKEHSYVQFNREKTTPDDSSTPAAVTETSEKLDNSPGINELQAVS